MLFLKVNFIFIISYQVIIDWRISLKFHCKVQGLFVPFACVGSVPVRVLRLYTTNTLDILKHLLLRHMYNLPFTDAYVLRAQALRSETSYWRMFSSQVLILKCSLAN